MIDPRRIRAYFTKPWYAFWRLLYAYAYKGREYTVHAPHGYRVLTPWFSDDPRTEFAQAIDRVRVKGSQLGSTDRAYMLYQLFTACLGLPGDVAECGVFQGATGHLLAVILSRHGNGRDLHLFNTFQGMPDTASPNRDWNRPGDFGNVSLADVQRHLAGYPSIRYHVGMMPQTFNEVSSVATYAFVHLDVDIYPSMIECCRWFWPRLSIGGNMVFDDYGFYMYRYAARAAADEYLASVVERAILIPGTGQAFVVKR